MRNNELYWSGLSVHKFLSTGYFNCIPKRDGCLRTSHTFNCIPKAGRKSKPHPANREHALQDYSGTPLNDHL